MTDLRAQLESWLRGAGRVAILGVGNPLRGDDILGLAVVRRLKGAVPGRVQLYECETVPESFTGAIRRLEPSHVLMIDAAQLGSKPGTAMLIPAEMADGLAISTHTLPLSIMAYFLEREVNADVRLLAVQPKRVDFGVDLSPEVGSAVKDLAKILIKVLNKVSSNQDVKS